MTITDALRAAARHVEEHKAILAWEGPEIPSAEQKARLIAEVSSLGTELDSLADASETARVYQREYETIRGELQRCGFTLDPKVDRAVTDAFLADTVAKAPVPRFRVMGRA